MKDMINLLKNSRIALGFVIGTLLGNLIGDRSGALIIATILTILAVITENLIMAKKKKNS